MKKSEKGYSLVVLIIAIVVIIIITGGAISTLNMSMEERKINNFIYDLNNIEEATKQYYSATGTIPTLAENVDVSSLMGTGQLNPFDGGSYSQLNIDKLEVNNIHEPDKTYVINTESLKVYMMEGIEYRDMTFYTITDTLMGSNTKYTSQNMDIVCTISPSVWTEKVNIRVTVPNVSDSLSGWTFKYNIGPKDAKFFSTGGKEFEYGKTISVTTNGAYSIYVKDADGKEIVKNVVVKNIDDIPPKYTLNGTELTIMDDELGIKEVRYKTYSQVANNAQRYEDQGKAGDNLDFYLLGGKGNTVESLKNDIENYSKQMNLINSDKEALDDDYEALSEEEKAALTEQYETSTQELADREAKLKSDYAHILNENERYVLYVEDYNNNALVIVEDIVTFKKVCEMFNITPPDYANLGG